MISHLTCDKQPVFRPKALSLMIASLLTLPVVAQTESNKQTTTNGEQNTETMETIVVTARQSKENFSDVPFTINVMDQDYIEDRGLLNLKDAIRNVPGVDINDTGGPSQNGVRIRGVGSLYLANRDDTSVSIAVDGIPTATDNLFMSTFDVAQIEVLKGPQGSVYGRNSEAGAINITTNRPTEEFEASVHGRYGQDAQYLAQGVISGPLANGFKARVAVQKKGADHWIENANTGEPITELNDLATRGQLLWDNENTSLLLSAEHHQAKGGVGIQILRPYGDKPVMAVAPERYKNNEKKVDRLALNIEHKLDFATFTSVTARTEYDIQNEVSFDANLNKKLYGFAGESVQQQAVEDKAFSQDLRLASLPDSPLFWIVGASYWKSEHQYKAVSLGRPGSSQTAVDSKNLGIYGEVTYPLSKSVDITAGARYSRDEKDFRGTFDLGSTVLRSPRNIDDSYSTGRIALSYAMSDTTNVYVLNSRGYKARGFNEYATQPADSVPFRAAEVNSFEAGFKSVNNEYKYRLNGAVFYNDVKDDHVLGFNPTTFASNVLNADTRSYGVELETRWFPLDGLTITAALAYIDTEITTDVKGVFGGDVKAGNETPDTPKFSGNLGIDWLHDLSHRFGGQDIALEASLTYRYQGKRAADPQNNFDLHGYSKVDLQLGLSSARGRVYLWADNLTDEQYDLYGFGFGLPGGETGVPARGRSAGIGVELSFN